MTTHSYTLNELCAHREHINVQLRQAEQELERDYRQIFLEEKPSSTPVEHWMGMASKAWFVFDGALAGYKLFQRMKSFTQKRKG